MKISYLSLLILLFICAETSAQVLIDGIDINKLDLTYCQLTAQNGQDQAKVWIDYGKPVNAPSVVTEPNGPPVEFGTVIDALNFMTAHGWELVSSQIHFGGENQSKYRSVTFMYLLRRKATSK